MNLDQQIGNYFGATVCVTDLDGDGGDDILVGSPYFSKVHDEGRVYVYMNKRRTQDFNYAGTVMYFIVLCIA